MIEREEPPWLKNAKQEPPWKTYQREREELLYGSKETYADEPEAEKTLSISDLIVGRKYYIPKLGKKVTYAGIQHNTEFLQHRSVETGYRFNKGMGSVVLRKTDLKGITK